MKLSIFSLISSSIAVDTEYRLITNKDGWQTMPTPSWWDSKPMTTRYNTLRKNAGRFFAHIQTEKDSDGNNMNIHWKNMLDFSYHLEDVLDDAERLRQETCSGSSARKRRSDKDEEEDEDFVEDDALARGKKPFRKSIRKDAKNYFRNIGRFVKFNVYDGQTVLCQRIGERLVSYLFQHLHG